MNTVVLLRVVGMGLHEYRGPGRPGNTIDLLKTYLVGALHTRVRALRNEVLTSSDSSMQFGMHSPLRLFVVSSCLKAARGFSHRK